MYLAPNKKTMDCHNVKSHDTPCNFTLVGYFFVARFHCHVFVPDFTHKVEHLLSNNTEGVHISRIYFYTNSLVGCTVQMKKSSRNHR